MRLSQFIRESMFEILTEWEAYARTLIPPAETMSVEGLRDHAELILLAIAKDIEAAQSESQREKKSKGWAEPLTSDVTSAAAHGALRQLAGFDPVQLAAEFRALRGTVLRLWKLKAGGAADPAGLEDIHRFNEGLDQALAESIASFSDKIGSSRDTFLAIFGHDLRNPLSAVSGCLRILNDLRAPAAQRERAFGIASRSLGSVERMIADLLEYTRARLGGGIAVAPRATDLAALCMEVVEEVRAAHPGHQFVLDAPQTLSATVDPDRMRQALINLLANAVHHGAPDAPIAVTVEDRTDGVLVEVRNRGDAIPEDMQQVIFNPLVQLAAAESATQDRPSTSMGLGLFIAREIANAHGGKISVTSTAAAGTAFTIRLKGD